MYMLKKCTQYLLLFLIITSVYHDLTTGSLPHTESNIDQAQIEQTHHEIIIVKRDVQAGETVLSIIEKINQDQLHELDISKILSDFKQLNPDADPFNLQLNKSYYFPVY